MSNTAEGELSVSVEAPVGIINLDRAAKRNAMTYSMWAALGEACHRLAGDPQVRVVVLRGVGDHFCAGADITELLADRPAGTPSFMDVNMAAEHALANLPKPTVASVQGDCVGGGCALAIDCDLRIAASTARFGITPAKLGIVYPASSLERVVHLLGPSAKRLLYTGELIGAERALQIGLVDEVVSPERLAERTSELCAELAQRSLLTQAATKDMVAAVLRDGAVPAELAASWAREAAGSADPVEGVAAFVERRHPQFDWSGRRTE